MRALETRFYTLAEAGDYSASYPLRPIMIPGQGSGITVKLSAKQNNVALDGDKTFQLSAQLSSTSSTEFVAPSLNVTISNTDGERERAVEGGGGGGGGRGKGRCINLSRMKHYFAVMNISFLASSITTVESDGGVTVRLRIGEVDSAIPVGLKVTPLTFDEMRARKLQPPGDCGPLPSSAESELTFIDDPAKVGEGGGGGDGKYMGRSILGQVEVVRCDLHLYNCV